MKINKSNSYDPIFSEIKNKDIAKGILLTLLITDGSVYNNKKRKETYIRLYNKDKILHNLFKKVMTILFNKQPSLYIYPSKRAYTTHYTIRNHSIILKQLYNLSTTFNTKPKNNQNPTIKSIFNKSKKLKTLCFRVAMSTEGCISINKREKVRLRFGCSNPKLVSEWIKLAKDIGITMNLAKDKNVWSGIQGLNSDKISNIEKFINIGGFIKGCRAHRSKYHKNWEKNKILMKAYQMKNN